MQSLARPRQHIHSILSSIDLTQRRDGGSCLDQLRNRSFSRYFQHLNDCDMNRITHKRISFKPEHAIPLFEGLLIDVLANNMPAQDGCNPSYGSSYTLSSDELPMIEAQPVPKRRLPKNDKLGRGLKQFHELFIDASQNSRYTEKKTSGVSTSLGVFTRS